MMHCIVPYTAKHLRVKTFELKMENGYLLETFRGSMLVDLYCHSTIPWFVRQDSWLSKKLQKPWKFSPSKVLPCPSFNSLVILKNYQDISKATIMIVKFLLLLSTSKKCGGILVHHMPEWLMQKFRASWPQNTL